MRAALISLAVMLACGATGARAQSTAAIRGVFGCINASTGQWTVCQGVQPTASAYQQLGNAIVQSSPNLRGPAGATGATGPAGPKGDPGTSALNAQGQMTAPVIGDVSAAPATSVANGASNAMQVAARAALQPSVADYMPSGTRPGTGQALYVLASQAAGDKSVTVRSVPGLTVGALVTSPYLPTGTTITVVGSGASATATCTTTQATLTAAHELALAPAMTGSSNGLVCSGVIGVPVGAQVTTSGGASVGIVRSVSYAGGNTSLWLVYDVSADVASGAALTASYSAVPLTLSAGWTQAITPAIGQIGIAQTDDSQAFVNVSFYSREDLGGHRGLSSIPAGGYYRGSVAYLADGTGYEWTAGYYSLPGSASFDASAGLGYDNARFAKAISFKDDTTAGGVLALYDILTEPEQTVTQGEALLVKQINNTRLNDGGVWGPGMTGEEIQQSIASNIHYGIMWAYHSTDFAEPGQMISWAGVEAELHNTSGYWGAFGGNPLAGNKTGLHIDNIAPVGGATSVPNSTALEPSGAWHNDVLCEANTLDWCVEQVSSSYSDLMMMPIAGLDARGRTLTTALAVAIPAAASSVTVNGNGAQHVTTAATRTADIGANGEIGASGVNTPVIGNYHASVGNVVIEDGGRFNAPVALSVGAPPAGGTQATASVAAYTLRAVQGAIALSGGDNLSGGTVFNVGTSSQCSDVPQVTWDGTEFVVSHAGLCQTMPSATYDTQGRAHLTLAAADGSTTRQPVIEPLWGVSSITVTASGADYNGLVPPEVFGSTVNTSGALVGHIYTPLHLSAQMTGYAPQPIDIKAPARFAAWATFGGGVSLQSITLAQSSPNCGSVGSVVFISDARNTGEAAGSGTGAMAYCTMAGKWFVNGAAAQN